MASNCLSSSICCSTQAWSIWIGARDAVPSILPACCASSSRRSRALGPRLVPVEKPLALRNEVNQVRQFDVQAASLRDESFKLLGFAPLKIGDGLIGRAVVHSISRDSLEPALFTPLIAS